MAGSKLTFKLLKLIWPCKSTWVFQLAVKRNDTQRFQQAQVVAPGSELPLHLQHPGAAWAGSALSDVTRHQPFNRLLAQAF